MSAIQDLIQRVKDLRTPGTGCPWDLAQTHESVAPYFLEEVHEFLDALDRHGPNSPHTWEELGDVLFQIILHAQMLQEEGRPGFDEIARRTADKIVERHPHVFDPTHPKFETPEQVNKAWEKIKASRRAARAEAAKTRGEVLLPDASPTPFQVVDSVPRSLPALQRSARLGEKAASFGFDWPDAASVWPKIAEELAELDEARQESNEAHEKEELGDLIFVLAQYARKRGWHPEQVLAAANEKFLGRYRIMDEAITKSGRTWTELSLEELEEIWQQAKRSS